MGLRDEKEKQMAQHFQILESRFEKPQGVTNKLFFITMAVIAILGLAASYFNL